MGSAISGVLSPFTSAVGGVVGGVAGGISAGVLQPIIQNLIPEIPVADQAQLQSQIAEQQRTGQGFIGQGSQLQQQANQQLGQVQQGVQQGQQAVDVAQGVNLGGDVASSMGLTQQAAEGLAPSAAQAQLQSGKDQAIATQMAMANSGNVSQMIGGQKEAMMNAANITQQAANQAAQLRAQEMGQARGLYAQQSAQQAGQAAQNAGLQQQQTAQQGNVYGQQLAGAQGYAGLGSQSLASAQTGQMAAQQLKQEAATKTAEARGAALGGLIQGATGAVSGLLSDKNLKKDIKDTKPSKFFEALNAKTYKYKDSDGKNGRIEGEHIGIIAQDVEKAPGGESLMLDLPEGKGIDIAAAVGTLMAGAAETAERLKDIEALFKSKKGKK